MDGSGYKICFVYPDFESLGVEYLMAVSLQAGYKVELVYYHAENDYLVKKERAIFYPKIARKILATKPDAVAFSCVTDNYQYQLKCAKAVKKIKPEIINIFGGIHPTAVPDLVLREAAVDVVAIGEAETAFINFLQKCRKESNLLLPEKEVEGIVFKKKGKIIGKFKEGPLQNLDSLPYPHKEPFFPSINSLVYQYRIITSRGCPYSCTYCFNSFLRIMRGKNANIRQRSVDNVIGELSWAKEKFKIKYVWFLDDSFTTNKRWIAEFSIKYKKKIGLPFLCLANPDYIDKKVVELLKSAGCLLVQIGVQSLCQEICRKTLHRMVTKEKISRVIKELKNAGIMIQADHMFGIPGDTIENQEKAILYYNEHRPDFISIFWLTYYPKTQIIQTAVQKGILSLKDIRKIENGERLTGGTIHDGGSMGNPGPFYSVQFLMNYLPFLPKWLVKFLVVSRFYQIFKIRNYYLSTALPRTILSAFDKRYFAGRTLLMSFLDNKG